MRGALLLDCDGVIVDSEPTNFAAWDDAFAEILGRRSDAGPVAVVGQDRDACFALWCGADLPSLAERERVLALRLRLYAERAAAGLPLVPGIEALLASARARGWPVAIVSGASAERLQANLRACGMRAQVDLVIGGGKSWRLAAERLGVAPGRCVALDDSVTGVAAARAQEIGRVVGVATTLTAETLFAAGAHEVVARPDEVDLACPARGA
jgi:HAD superfamily hydrolase (TIGR01509 family)